jgi:hypothetical protein
LISFSVKIDASKLGVNAKARMLKAHAALDSQIIKDTDPFVPFRTGALASSPMRAGGKVGEIVYATPYARRLYNSSGYNFRKSHHPQATDHWFEKAKAVWLPEWVRITMMELTGRGKP